MNQQLKNRFNELEQQAQDIAATESTKSGAYSGVYQHIDADVILGWCVKARNLLSTACGRESEHFKSFVEAEEPQSYEDSPTRFKRVLSVFRAAKEDFEGGYLTTMRNLVQAEVFTTELEQADELLGAGYPLPAAVIAGVVLETTLRDLCAQSGLVPGKLSKMNDDLAKAGRYNSVVQKQITALAAVRNSAAHGKVDEFTREDVKAMIRDVERLLGMWLS
ncbi:DUF4145 domain-containing protein [Rugamonas apoptosis]|uniref:DUF4145 domain-containing protein n=1 Tax=Rugamonas apoptosis TaxID=2758570 RepID=A0A7W2F706_9BURK|nr:DUF4145 domain-containing protein [Rugamonas apoptosis]MBA5686338.1 DUF4145 domain-containing protein [Rugamonas apoptosis]